LKENQLKSLHTQPDENLDQDEINMQQHKNNPDLFKYYFKNVIDKRAKKLLEEIDQTSYRQFTEFKKKKAIKK